MRLENTLHAISSVGEMINEQHEPGPFLVVISVSIVAAWVREFSRWLPEMRFLFCYTEEASTLRMIRQYKFNPLRKSKSKVTGVTAPCPVNNSRTCNDGHGPSSLFVGALIAEDEGHRLNNQDIALRRYLAGFCQRIGC